LTAKFLGWGLNPLPKNNPPKGGGLNPLCFGDCLLCFTIAITANCVDNLKSKNLQSCKIGGLLSEYFGLR
jgi:hypothetical protein